MTTDSPETTPPAWILIDDDRLTGGGPSVRYVRADLCRPAPAPEREGLLLEALSRAETATATADGLTPDEVIELHQHIRAALAAYEEKNDG